MAPSIASQSVAAPMIATGEREFFAGLESLRGVAAVCVILYHVTWLNPVYEFGLVRNASVMVDFFFVLSGFVIAHAHGRKMPRPSCFCD